MRSIRGNTADSQEIVRRFNNHIYSSPVQAIRLAWNCRHNRGCCVSANHKMERVAEFLADRPHTSSKTRRQKFAKLVKVDNGMR
eukprot:10307395-Karenia_brevis.AAC.1